MLRTFVAVNLDIGIKEKISVIRNEVKIFFPDKSAKWEDSSKYHITLQFLGDTPQNLIADISSELGNIELGSSQIHLVAGGIDAFPNMYRPRILFLSINDNGGLLQQIAGEVNRRLSVYGFLQDKKFHSHVTLARIKIPVKISEAERIKNIRGNFSCDVKSFELMASTLKPTGSEYKLIKSFPLK